VNTEKAAKRGPKPLHGENMQAFHFRMTKAQREKLDLLGGAAWLRERIDKAKEPQR
jgi:hypothetical protein